MTDLRTPTGLRSALAETLSGLMNGDVTTTTANAVANVAGKVFSSYKLQIDYHKHVGTIARIPELDTLG